MIDNPLGLALLAATCLAWFAWQRIQAYEEYRERGGRQERDLLLVREFAKVQDGDTLAQSVPRTTCRYCTRTQRRPQDGHCVGCGAILPVERERLDVSTFDGPNKWIDGQGVK